MNKVRRRIPENLTDFLNYLPSLSQNNYDTPLSYIIWKALDTCLSTDTDLVDWNSIISPFYSENWTNGSYQAVLSNDNWKKINFEENTGNDHVGMSCGRQCFNKDLVYYCFTCTRSPFYEICESCFDESKHIGHSYVVKVINQSQGRICHCGNPAVFKNADDAFKCKNDANNTAQTLPPSGLHHNVYHTVSIVLDHIIGILTYLKEQNRHENNNSRDHNNNITNKTSISSRMKYPNLYDELNRSNSNANEDERSVNYMIQRQYEQNNNLEQKWTLQIEEEDCKMQQRDFAKCLIDILDTPMEYAVNIIDMIDSVHSAVTILESNDFIKLKQIQQEFYEQNITLYIRRKHDVFKKKLVEDLSEWLYNLCLDRRTPFHVKTTIRLSLLELWQCKFDLTEGFPENKKISLFGNFFAPNKNVWFNPWPINDMHDSHITKIMQDYNINIINSTSHKIKPQMCSIRGSRLQYLLTECTTNLSKFASLRFIKIISTMFSICDEVKKFLALQYFDVYLHILYSSVSSERSKLNGFLMHLLSQYTVQDPEIANLAIISGFIEKALKFSLNLLCFKAEDLDSNRHLYLIDEFTLPKDSIKNRKVIICFQNLCSLLLCHTIPKEVLERRELFLALLKVTSEFDNILPLKRETNEHVEFENFDFSLYYIYFTYILMMVDAYSRSLSQIKDVEERKITITRLLNTISDKEIKLYHKFKNSPDFNSTLSEDGEKPNIEAIFSLKEKICNYVTDTINFQVGVDTQNFFNPMSYFFRFVVQWGGCNKEESNSSSLTVPFKFQEFLAKQHTSLLVSEVSLSTLVLIGQINTGFWVRNGTPITHQLRLYTKYGMREFAYSSDLFNVQVKMSMTDPNAFMVTFLSRWGLKHWANGVPMGDYPDEDTTIGIVGECLLLLIQLFSEIKSLTSSTPEASLEKAFKDEIINGIGFDTCTYSKIRNTLPDHIGGHPLFDDRLEQYSDYLPPKSLSDTGTFKLKTKFRKEVNPYYFGLANNKRYEVEKKLRTYMAKVGDVNFDDTFIPAGNFADLLKSTIYSGLYSISSVDTFGLFLKHTLDHIKKGNYETLLSRSVHLIHICVVNNLNEFMKIFWREYAVVDTEYYHYHSIGSILYYFLSVDDFSYVHGKIREIFSFMKIVAPHIDINSYLREQTASFNPEVLWIFDKSYTRKNEGRERKKLLAIERREKILKKLAKQQMKFIENNHFTSQDKEEYAGSDDSSQEEINKLGWKYPDDGCVFCKMKKEDDAFVYFSYLEQNICDHGVDFPDTIYMKNVFNSMIGPNIFKNISAGTKLIENKPVLRTCGHGSHIRCLGTHMKSARSTQSHTTKNTPVAYGYGLSYCPVCNSLSNCFLPRLEDYSDQKMDDFFENNQNIIDVTSELLVSTAKKTLMIFEDMERGDDQDTGYKDIKVIDRLLADTVRNMELRLRCKSHNQKDTNEMIKNQCALTLKLLAGFKLFLQRYCISESFEDLKHINWKKVIYASDNNLLYAGCKILGTYNQEPSTSILNLMKREFHKSFMVLIMNLVQVDFYNSTNVAMKPWNSEITSLPIKSKSFFRVFQAYLSFYLYDTRNINQSCIVNHAYLTMAECLKTFLQRLYFIFRAFYSIESDHKGRSKFANEFEFLLSYFRIPNIRNFSEFIDSFAQNDIDEITMLMHKVTKGEEKASIMIHNLKNINFNSFAPFKFIDLPKNLSEFYRREESKCIYRILEYESAICLLCGERLHIQKPFPLYGYLYGECTSHVRKNCKATSIYGVFLLIDTNVIYLSYGTRGSFYRTPYLNKYGEPDEEFKFGNPVYLNKSRYEHLSNDILMGNMIPHVVFRLSEGNADLGGWETM
ncbi:hypothetical protein KAFR_0J00650 [Kazachstania africana CBS 2517]|uniref:E3 ubiquitin-protein ligase n=1 Tax=Kazachstania africana (strain ATCC 22294 / BCRC 22015 / CBS 2517 / CECT 1963 / NBRC 1671 / NRRL Y-8276) TaxID=1071382 RepID=H2B0I3_KAZAF|nr:hypothetical protein KAFR_0J00650 [Kazachstania africana CBS 2517]CCF60133.1 hypothetical protein KAFR_0J00650 [Kazachstania africana CBS 2517]